MVVPATLLSSMRTRPLVVSSVGLAWMSPPRAPNAMTRWPTEMSSLLARPVSCLVTIALGSRATVTLSLKINVPSARTSVAPRTVNVLPLRATTLPRTTSVSPKGTLEPA